MNGIRAYLLTASQRQTLQAYPDGALAWNDQGIFCYAGPWSKRPKKSAVVWEELRHLIVTPGFIDVHCHLPQYPSVGSGGYPLLPWLKKFIFPLERAFTPKRAELEAPLFYNDLKRIFCGCLYHGQSEKHRCLFRSGEGKRSANHDGADDDGHQL
jgi:guanine deaminase